MPKFSDELTSFELNLISGGKYELKNVITAETDDDIANQNSQNVALENDLAHDQKDHVDVVWPAGADISAEPEMGVSAEPEMGIVESHDYDAARGDDLPPPPSEDQLDWHIRS